MYAITSRLHGPFATVQLNAETELRLVCAEFDTVATCAREMQSSLLSDAIAKAQVAEATLNWPTAMATALADGLAARVAHQRSSPTFLFAAIRLTDDVVQVCTAGDLRVHLIVDDDVVETTRDHVMQSDAPALVPPHAATVTSRWLGGTCFGPPESHVWNARAPYAVGICSSHLHRYRAAPRHKDDLLAQFELANASEGLAVWIERRTS